MIRCAMMLQTQAESREAGVRLRRRDVWQPAAGALLGIAELVMGKGLGRASYTHSLRPAMIAEVMLFVRRGFWLSCTRYCFQAKLSSVCDDVVDAIELLRVRDRQRGLWGTGRGTRASAGYSLQDRTPQASHTTCCKSALCSPRLVSRWERWLSPSQGLSDWNSLTKSPWMNVRSLLCA